MPTREENLKKINDELRYLSDDDLEKIAGGTGNDTDLKEKLKKFTEDMMRIVTGEGSEKKLQKLAEVSNSNSNTPTELKL